MRLESRTLKMSYIPPSRSRCKSARTSDASSMHFPPPLPLPTGSARQSGGSKVRHTAEPQRKTAENLNPRLHRRTARPASQKPEPPSARQHHGEDRLQLGSGAQAAQQRGCGRCQGELTRGPARDRKQQARAGRSECILLGPWDLHNSCRRFVWPHS